MCIKTKHKHLHAIALASLTLVCSSSLLAQSEVTGEVLSMVSVEQSSHYYGEPIQNSDGQWRNDSRPEVLVEDGALIDLWHTLSNELLPGAGRKDYKSMSSLFDLRLGRDDISYRLYDLLAV